MAGIKGFGPVALNDQFLFVPCIKALLVLVIIVEKDLTSESFRGVKGDRQIMLDKPAVL